jgi:hypothetical protein
MPLKEARKDTQPSEWIRGSREAKCGNEGTTEGLGRPASKINGDVATPSNGMCESTFDP